MKLKNRIGTLIAATAAVIFVIASPAHAGGPLVNCSPGVPFTYPGGGANIPWNPDLGPLGTLNNADAVMQSAAAFAAWTVVPSSTVSFAQGAPLPVNVDTSNFNPWVFAPAPDGLNAIVYDEDGSLFNLLFGFGTGVLGFAGPEWGITAACEITESFAFINGGSVFQGLPVNELQCVQHHEFGHFQNLAHSVVNEQIAAFSDYTGPAPFDTFGFPVNLVNRIETMSPFIFVNGGQCDAHTDDVMSVSNIYPAAGYPGNTGSITGHILAPNGVTQLTGVNVIARNIANPFDDAVSALSSDVTDTFTQGAPFVGQYTFNNLTDGASYAIYVDGIIQGGFSTPPLVPLPGPEEFYNGAGESSNGATDDPSVYSAVVAAAGSQSTGVDIIFNSPAPGQALALGDDDAIELFMPFTFEYCGESYNSLFVNSNGSVSFGAGSTDFSESVLDHLLGPPRIAGVWDDLNPASGGVVTFFQTINDFTVSFQGVPEFPAAGANSFDIVLTRSSNQVDLLYGDLSAPDGLAGLSCGGLKTTGNEAEVDLTALDDQSKANAAINARNESSKFEIFTTFDNDLSGRSLSFNTPNAFKDSFENNDTFGSAKAIGLPFDSADRRGSSEIFDFTEIRPVGGDVDYFRFNADAGQTLVAEVTAGSLDSVLGLFDSTGTLVAADDDGGLGLLSKLQFPIAAAGQYTLAVSTFPDFDFSGDGGSGSRYVVNVQSIDGFVLSLGDDSTQEVDLGFSFPFQGSSYDSVFVNSNGNLTFGSGSTDFTESVSELLSGPPRIAPLWDDLSPNNGGQVVVEFGAADFTVTFDGVPEFQATGANTFSVTLHATGDYEIAYGATNGNDALAGVSEGGGAADPGPSDLSTSASWPGTGTTYQLFGSGTFDLDFSTLTFIP
jgi:hypothetical protein